MDEYYLLDSINDEKIQELLNKAKLCQYLITNYNVLSDEYLITGLQELAPNILTEEDYYKIISMHDGKEYSEGELVIHRGNYKRVRINYGKQYHGPIDMRTTLYEHVSCDEEEKKMGVILTVLYTLGVSKVIYYSKERIQELLDNKKIVILNKSYNPGGAPHIGRPPEECPQYELAMGDVDHKEFLSSEGKYYETTLKYIKDKVDCKTLDNFRDYLLVLAANEMSKASFLQRQFMENGFQKRIKDLRSK